MKYLLLILLVSQTAQARGPFDLSEDELNPDTSDVLIKKPEKYLRNESMIYDFDTDLGIKDQRKYTGTDRNKFAIAGHVSGNYEQFRDILGLEFNYMRRSQSYSQLWYGFQFFQHKTFFDAITKNHDKDSSTNANSDAQLQRPTDVKNTVLAGGLGAGYRFKLLMEFFPTEDVFETVDVFVNYVTLDETYVDRKYKGYGLTTTYGIHKRLNTTYFWGGKIAYNLASVTRDAIGDESKDDRTFALGWLTLGLELGFFF